MTNRTCVLIHGSFHGPWCWSAVAGHLHERGLSCLTPELKTDRADIQLDDHLEALTHELNAIPSQSLTIVGHSYAGMLLPGIAAALTQRVDKLIYLDAFVPELGESALTLLGEFGGKLAAAAGANGDMIPPADPRELGISDQTLASATADRLTPMPLSTHRSPSRFSAQNQRHCENTFVRCVQFSGFAGQEERARQFDWRVEQLDTGHDAMLIDPLATAQLIARISGERN